MKKWSKPEIRNLCVQLTKDFDIEPMKSEASCGSTYDEAIVNKNKGCSVTWCMYYVKHNNGNGNGGKCGGGDNLMS